MQLWYPGAIRRPGPPEKVGYSHVGESGPKRGTVVHSAEGWWSGSHAVLDDLDRRASWHFTVGTDGMLEQHYPITFHCWHAGDVDDDGGVAANVDLIGIEELGMAGTPLSVPQNRVTADVIKWSANEFALAEFGLWTDWDMQAYVWLLAEHNWVSDVYTACPSDRVVWEELFKLLGGEAMTDEEKARMVALENQVKFQHEVLKIFRNRLMFNDAITLQAYEQAVENAVLIDETDGWEDRIEELEAQLDAIHDATA
jgi:hypothetical protein